MRVKPAGGLAVMADRRSAVDALDLFATPPWATRALICDVLATDDVARARFKKLACWEPAAGLGHMSEVLLEFFATVQSSDVHDYGYGHEIGSFVGDGADISRFRADWIITNPPFNLALEFAQRGIDEGREGLALLVRSVWAEGANRYQNLFSKRPPTIVAQFVERVPMVEGHWNPKASTATSYAWFIWIKSQAQRETRFFWIPPGARARHTKPDDVARFASRSAA